MARYKLNSLLSTAGCFVGLLSAFTVPYAVILTIAPPSIVHNVVVAGFGFLFNRWFWSTMLLLGTLGLIFSYWAHPESQLRRKLEKVAISLFRANYGWPWD